MKHPNVHQSKGLPCPYFIKTSGARYSGVPHTENASLSVLIFFFDKPKSVILIYPSLSMRTFSGLRLLR